MTLMICNTDDLIYLKIYLQCYFIIQKFKLPKSFKKLSLLYRVYRTVGEDSNSFLQLNSKDACLFVYKNYIRYK